MQRLRALTPALAARKAITSEYFVLILSLVYFLALIPFVPFLKTKRDRAPVPLP